MWRVYLDLCTDLPHDTPVHDAAQATETRKYVASGTFSCLSVSTTRTNVTKLDPDCV